MRSSLLMSLVSLIALAACGGGTSTTDAGPGTDGGHADLGATTDGGGSTDLGTATDSGGGSDLGTATDSGGGSDSGGADLGVAVDGGGTDLGGAIDGGGAGVCTLDSECPPGMLCCGGGAIGLPHHCATPVGISCPAVP